MAHVYYVMFQQLQPQIGEQYMLLYLNFMIYIALVSATFTDEFRSPLYYRFNIGLLHVHVYVNDSVTFKS